MAFYLIRFQCSRTQPNNYTDKTFSKQRSYWHYSYANSTNGRPLMSSLKHCWLSTTMREFWITSKYVDLLIHILYPTPFLPLPPYFLPWSPWYAAGDSKVLCKGPDNKQFRLWRALHKSSHRQSKSEWVRLCFKKTIYKKGSGPVTAHRAVVCQPLVLSISSQTLACIRITYRIWWHTDFWAASSEFLIQQLCRGSLRFRIFSKFPNEADAADPGTTLWEQTLKNHRCRIMV